MLQPLEICGHNINTGESKVIKLDIADLASGTKIYIPIYVFKGGKEGKNILLTAGLHGDEINGIEIVRRIITESMSSNFKEGALIAIPLLNPYGFINFSRDVVEGKDINRSFPGAKKGSLAARIARVVSKEILPKMDLVMDFHTGGASRYNYPQTRYTKSHLDSFELSKIFGAPVHLSSGLIPKSFRAEAIKQKKAIVVYEGGESKRIDEEAVQEGINGIHRVFNHYNLLEKEVIANDNRHFVKKQWIRASDSGLFRPSVLSGEEVIAGQILGYINQIDPKKPAIKVKSSSSGFVIGHNNSPVVNQGDALFHLASE